MNNPTLYLYPFDHQNPIFIADESFITRPMCLLIQTTAPYSPNTLYSLQTICSEAYHFSQEYNKLIHDPEYCRIGLSFLNQEDTLHKVQKHLNQFKIKKLKERKQNIPFQAESPIDTLLLSPQYTISTFNQLITQHYHFIYIYLDINHAGKTLILFQPTLIQKIKQLLQPIELNSQDDLAYW